MKRKNVLNQALTTSAIAFSAAVALLGGVASPVQALTIFTDRTAWTTAIGSAYPIKTEDFSTPIPDAQTITFTNYPIVSTGSGGTTKFNGVGNDGRYSGGIRRGDPKGQGGDFFESITWTFPELVKGFFFDYISMEKVVIEGDFNGNGTIDPGESIRIKSDGRGPTGSFGLIGHGMFQNITFKIDPAENNAAENFKIDNLAVAVPTPAMLPGLMGLAAVAMRRRKAEEDAEQSA